MVGLPVPFQVSEEFANLVRQMNQMVDREMKRDVGAFSPLETFRPAVNLYETQGAFLICVDVAGMDQNDIDVSLEKEMVIIRGRRQSPMPPDGSRAVAMHLMEIDHGSFCRSVEVPAGVDMEGISANYHVGMLWVTLPKKRGRA
ncbi:MAG TPA: Hsp20/alpha crystallin family protein [Phycisphaerae bacterium]|nr:Hsp20/alpha crystallin family protein [Phycisphaerae bacterium]